MDEKKMYPCDFPTYDWESGREISVCPFADCYSGYEAEMCRVCCGLGVDE